MISVTVDQKGRLLIPKTVRDRLGVRPGDSFFVTDEGGDIRLMKAEEPLDALAQEALDEHQAGRTRPLADFARECGLPPDDQ